MSNYRALHQVYQLSEQSLFDEIVATSSLFFPKSRFSKPPAMPRIKRHRLWFVQVLQVPEAAALTPFRIAFFTHEEVLAVNTKPELPEPIEGLLIRFTASEH